MDFGDAFVARWRLAAPWAREGGRRRKLRSYRHQYGVEPIFGNWDAVLHEGGGVNLDRFLDLLDRLLPAPAQADAAGEAGAFRHPGAVLAWVYYDLPHGINLDYSQILYLRLLINLLGIVEATRKKTLDGSFGKLKR